MQALNQFDKRLLRLAFSAAANNYDNMAALQRRVGKTLLKLSPADALDRVVVDIGCGTGFLTAELLKKGYCRQVVGLDIALNMLLVTQRKRHDANISLLCADAENLPLQSNCVDLFCSNLALQWCLDLPRMFINSQKILRKKGRLVFSIFGPETLKELKHSWKEVDDKIHVNEFFSAEQLTAFLYKAGFDNVKQHNHVYLSQYMNVMELMWELKGIGAHNVSHNRNKGLTGKTQFHKMLKAYERHRQKKMLPATFEVLYFMARAAK